MTELFVAVNAKYPHTNLAVRLLCAEAQKAGLPCGFVEHTINNDAESVITDVLSRAPRVAAFSCYIWNIRFILSVSKGLKSARPEMRILLGGPEVSFDAEEILAQNPSIDFVIRGEGEAAHCDFAMFLLGQKPLTECASLTFRDGEKIVSNPVRFGPQFENADFPYPDLADLKKRVIYYEASRGCPFACSFCLSSESGRYREKPIDIVKRDMLTFIHADLKIVKLVDRTFNTDKKRAIELLEFIMENSKSTCFHLELAPSLLDDAILDCLAKAKPGIFQLEIGIQSTNPETLAAINRREDFSAFAPKIRCLVGSHNMHIHVDLIAGLPYEGLAEFKQSFDDVFSLAAHNLQLGFLKLLKGAPLRAEAERYGIAYDQNAPYEVLHTPWLSAEDLRLLEEIEYLLKRFYNGGLFRYTVLLLAKHFNSAFDLFCELNLAVKTAKMGIKKASEAQLTEFLWRFCGEHGAIAAQEMLLFEALNKRRLPKLPEDILSPEHWAFKKRYFASTDIPLPAQKNLFAAQFSFDALRFFETLKFEETPTVIIFDYSNFERGAVIRRG